MSLLMDALRKAEEEKRKAAERSGEAEAGTAEQQNGTGEFEQATDSIEFEQVSPTAQDDSAEIPVGDNTTGTDTVESENTRTNTITAPQMTLEPVAGEDTGAGSPVDAPIEMSSPEEFGDQTDVFDDSLEMRGPSDASLELLAADFTNQNKAAAEGEARHDTTQGSDTEPGERMGDTTPRPTTPEELLSLTLTQDNDATVPSDRAIQNSLNDYFENSQSMETGSLEMPRQTGPMAEAAAMDRTLGTPVSAETVFAASGKRRSSRAMGLLIVCLVGLAVLLAGGGLYYGLQTPAPKSLPSPSVVVGVEKTDKPEFELPEVIPRQTAPEELLAGAVSESELIARAQAGQSAQAGAEETTAPVIPDPAPLPINPQPAPAISGSESLTQTDTAPAPDPMDDPASAVLAAAQQSSASSATRPAPAITTDAAPVLSSGAIKISRGKKVSTTDQTAASAYAAYSEGDLPAAKSLYQDVIKRDPRSRNALLGLAGVALREGNQNEAYEYYQRVLSLYPADATAKAAVLELQGYSSSAQSDLKNRISETPEDPYLHFVLGNLHARNGEWGDAEQAYFEAVRLAPDNPEFAFNLAVSLDRLRQGDAALRFYQQAMEGAGNQKVAFDTAAAASRIQALGNGGTP